MEIPVELRVDPPRATLDWVAASIHPDAQVTAVHRLRNASASAMHAVDVSVPGEARHELVIRRYARTDVAPDPGVVENEAAVLGLLAGATDLAVPALVAFDPAAASADVPALVMTRLAGHDDLAPADLDPYLDGLVAALRAVHAVPAPVRTLDNYRPWGLDRMVDPPSWTRRPDAWRRAFEIARRPVPAYAPVLCHRDFHPGNVLWDDGLVSGIVDWTHTCRGPAAADVAHCSQNLALLFGRDVADEFVHRYGPVDDLAWFEVVNAAGWSDLAEWRWHDAGRTDLTEDTLAQSFDTFIATAVDRLP